MSSLAVGRGVEDLGLWLAGLFTGAELAAAELLLQLSGAGGDGDKAASTSTALSSPPPWVSPCHEDLTEERVVKEQAVSTELDRRARKRYRRLAELYAVTRQVTTACDASAAPKKRKRHHRLSTTAGSGGGGDERYGEQNLQCPLFSHLAIFREETQGTTDGHCGCTGTIRC